MKAMVLASCVLMGSCVETTTEKVEKNLYFPPGATEITQLRPNESDVTGWWTYYVEIGGTQYFMLHRISYGSHSEISHTVTVLKQKEIK